MDSCTSCPQAAGQSMSASERPDTASTQPRRGPQLVPGDLASHGAGGVCRAGKAGSCCLRARAAQELGGGGGTGVRSPSPGWQEDQEPQGPHVHLPRSSREGEVTESMGAAQKSACPPAGLQRPPQRWHLPSTAAAAAAWAAWVPRWCCSCCWGRAPAARVALLRVGHRALLSAALAEAGASAAGGPGWRRLPATHQEFGGSVPGWQRAASDGRGFTGPRLIATAPRPQTR